MKKIVALSILGLLLLLLFGFLYKNNKKDIKYQESKCFSWSVYNPTLKAWRWRSEDLNEYFPTREDSVSNCVVMFNGIE